MKKVLRSISMILCLLLCLSIVSLPGYALRMIGTGQNFNGLDDYERFLEKNKMPFSYIHASRFTILGDFINGYVGIYTSAPYNSYHYRYSSGYTVYIDHILDEVEYTRTQIDTLPSDTVSMKYTTPPAEVNGYYYYFRNGLYYIYNESGNLYTLEWFANGIHFRIDVYESDSYSSVPVIEQLKSVSDEEANAAFEELCTSAGLTPYRKHFTIRKNLIKAAFIFLCVATCTTALCVCINRKKRRERAIRYACATYEKPESR